MATFGLILDFEAFSSKLKQRTNLICLSKRIISCNTQISHFSSIYKLQVCCYERYIHD